MSTEDQEGDQPHVIIDLTGLRDMSVEQLLKEAQKEQIVDLVGKLKAGVLSHQEHAILRQIIKDNGMTLPDVYQGPTVEHEGTQRIGFSDNQTTKTAAPPLMLPVFEEDNEEEEN